MKLTLIASLIVVAINAVFGTIIAWVLVRDEFPGKKLVNTVIDLPFALPTIVAGLTLLALYGDNGVLGLSTSRPPRSACSGAPLRDPAVRRPGRPADPDRARSGHGGGCGVARGGPLTIFRKIVLPNLTPAIAAGVALAFARAIGEFGSLILLSRNIPFKTEVVVGLHLRADRGGQCDGRRAGFRRLPPVSVAVLFLINWFGRRSIRT